MGDGRWESLSTGMRTTRRRDNSSRNKKRRDNGRWHPSLSHLRSERSAQQSLAALEVSADPPAVTMILRLAFFAAFASPVALAAARNQQPVYPTHALAGNGNGNRHYPCWAGPVAPPRLYCPRSSARGNHQRKPCGRLETKMMVATRDALPSLDSPAGAALAGEGLKPAAWKALLEAGELVSLEREKLLISQGDIYENPDDREVYLLLQGECRIEVRGKDVGKMGPGEFVGEGEVWVCGPGGGGMAGGAQISGKCNHRLPLAAE